MNIEPSNNEKSISPVAMFQSVSVTAQSYAKKRPGWKGTLLLYGSQLGILILALTLGSVALVGYVVYRIILAVWRLFARVVLMFAQSIAYGFQRLLQQGLAMILVVGGIGYGGYYLWNNDPAFSNAFYRAKFALSEKMGGLRQYLPSFGDMPGAEQLARAFGQEVGKSITDERVKTLADAIGKASLPDALAPLAGVLSDPKAVEKIASLIQTGKVDADNMDAVVPLLEQQVTGGGDAAVGAAAVQSLQQINSPLARSALRRLEADIKRMGLTEALGNVGKSVTPIAPSGY